MFAHNRKLYLILSAIILALSLYQLSILNSKKPTKKDDSTSNEYQINTQPLSKQKQGSIASH